MAKPLIQKILILPFGLLQVVIRETEESHVICMVSSFYEDYANELIRVAEKYGVRYFKWGAFPQYGCNAPGHYHGTSANSAEERANNYSFLLPQYMSKVINNICAVHPDAIVDFDLTEGERAYGLGFLAAGKFFSINNGPYYYALDNPEYAPGVGMG
jgi:alpha-galactosidase